MQVIDRLMEEIIWEFGSGGGVGGKREDDGQNEVGEGMGGKINGGEGMGQGLKGGGEAHADFAQSLKQPLKDATEGAATAVCGRLFHTLVADGKNEFRWISVLDWGMRNLFC